jgi:hypothetical protein
MYTSMKGALSISKASFFDADNPSLNQRIIIITFARQILTRNLSFKFIIYKKQLLTIILRSNMFGKTKRPIKSVTFVQPLKGEAYFYTPIAYSTSLQNSKDKKEKHVFNDSDLALAGKLKLIFEREKMNWFEVKEEKSLTPSKDAHYFSLYYYPSRLVARRASLSDEKATLEEIQELFDFIVTEDQTRFAEVWKTNSSSGYGAVVGGPGEEPETVSMIAAIEPGEEPETVSVTAENPNEESK